MTTRDMPKIIWNGEIPSPFQGPDESQIIKYVKHGNTIIAHPYIPLQYSGRIPRDNVSAVTIKTRYEK